jgi:hypothetical protein
VELLDLAVLALDADAVSRPQDRRVARALELGAQVDERPVQAPRVGPDDLHAAVEQPQRPRPAQAAAGVDVLGRAPGVLGAGPQQHDVERFERAALEGVLQVARLDLGAALEVAHVEPYARADEPVERQLVDRARGLAGAGREVVPRRVDVRAGVRDRRDRVVAPALAVGEILDRAAEDRRDELGGRRVVLALDDRTDRLARVVLERDREVDDPCHGGVRSGKCSARCSRSTSRIQRRSSWLAKR